MAPAKNMGRYLMAAKCKVCGATRSQRQIDRMNPCCESIDCQVTYSMQSKQQAKGKKLADKAWRAETAARRKAAKSKGEWAKEAQREFNRFIRLRDSDDVCISCGRHHSGQYHAGHYKTVGANPELRFNELNCHKQCAPCNNHLSGNIVNYRVRLIDKIGQDNVDFIEGPHEPMKYIIKDLERIKLKYKVQADELEKRINQI